MGSLVRSLWFVCACFLLVCHADHARFWWQELVCSFTLYWIPLVLLGLVAAVRGYRKGTVSAVRFGLTLVVHLWLLLIVVGLLRPYVYFSKWPGVDKDRSIGLTVLVVPWFLRESGVEVFDQLLQRYRSDLVVITGLSNLAALRDSVGNAFPFFMAFEDAQENKLLALSRYPINAISRMGSGFGGLPAMYGMIELPKQEMLELGVLSLSPIKDQESFEDNKLTARRMATLVRNSARHRMLIGSFFESPFSKNVSIFSRQGRLRSVMFGRGLHSTWDMHSTFLRMPADHAFVSRRIVVEEVELVDVQQSHHRGMFFKVALEP